MLAALTAEQIGWAVLLLLIVGLPVYAAAVFGTTVIMGKKGHSKGVGLALGILLPIIGLVIAWLLPDRSEERPPAPGPANALGTKRKLAISGLLIGATLAGLLFALLVIVLQADSSKKVDSQKTANASAEKANADLQAQFDLATENQQSGKLEQAFVNATNQKDFDAGRLDQAALDALKTPIVEIDWSFENGWIITVLWITLWAVVPLLAAIATLWFRDDSLPLTWAEAMLYGGTVFWYFTVAWGLIPHLMMRIWDDVAEITGTFTVFPTQYFGGVGWQWGWFAIRDMIVAGWYIVTLVAMFALWWWAQELPKRAAAKEGPVGLGIRSPYGRPVLSAGR